MIHDKEYKKKWTTLGGLLFLILSLFVVVLIKEPIGEFRTRGENNNLESFTMGFHIEKPYVS